MSSVGGQHWQWRVLVASDALNNRSGAPGIRYSRHHLRRLQWHQVSSQSEYLRFLLLRILINVIVVILHYVLALVVLSDPVFLCLPDELGRACRLAVGTPTETTMPLAWAVVVREVSLAVEGRVTLKKNTSYLDAITLQQTIPPHKTRLSTEICKSCDCCFFFFFTHCHPIVVVRI